MTVDPSLVIKISVAQNSCFVSCPNHTTTHDRLVSIFIVKFSSSPASLETMICKVNSQNLSCALRSIHAWLVCCGALMVYALIIDRSIYSIIFCSVNMLFRRVASLWLQHTQQPQQHITSDIQRLFIGFDSMLIYYLPSDKNDFCLMSNW